IECKDSDSPFVFLENLKNQRELSHPVPAEYVFPVTHYEESLGANTYRQVHPFVHLGLKDRHYYFGAPKKATQFAKVVRKGKDWVANHEGVYDSLVLPRAKALEFSKTDLGRYARSESKAVWLF